MGATNTKNLKGIVAPKILLAGVAAVVILLVIVLATTIFLTLRNNEEAEAVLIDSVKTELIASSVAGREIIDENLEFFEALNSQEDINEQWDEWVKITEELRLLNDEIGSKYIYALKEIDGEYFFVFDTDPMVQKTHDVFTSYELSSVHEEAFAGIPSADIMNVEDEWGSFNTGAVPLYGEDGSQIGIVATDIEDTFIERNRNTTNFFTTILIVATSAAVVMMLVILFMLIRRNSKMQQHLFKLANFDPISGLPKSSRESLLAKCWEALPSHTTVRTVRYTAVRLPSHFSL